MELPDPIEMLKMAVAILFGALFLLVGAMVYAWAKIRQFKEHTYHAKKCADAAYQIAEHHKVQTRTDLESVERVVFNLTKSVASLVYLTTQLVTVDEVDEPDELEEPDGLDDPYQVQVVNKQGDVLNVYDITDLQELQVKKQEAVPSDEHQEPEKLFDPIAAAAGMLNGDKD